MKVYDAICLSALRYGSEAWAYYARQLKLIKAWQFKSLGSMLGLNCWNKENYLEILELSYSDGIESNVGCR